MAAGRIKLVRDNDGKILRAQVVLELGRQKSRQCPACRTTWWLPDHPKLGDSCPGAGCDGVLGPVASRRRQAWISKDAYGNTLRTKAAAQAVLHEHATRVEQGTFTVRSDMTLAQWIDAWLPKIERTLKPSTFASYRHTMKTYVVPPLGDKRLQDLNDTILSAWVTDLELHGGRNGRPLSPKTVRNVAIALSRCLGGRQHSAVRRGLIPTNPMHGVDLPPPTDGEVEHWTMAQAQAFLRALPEDDPLRPFARLGLDTGLRRGELCGLLWKYVDFDKGTLYVGNNRVSVEYRIDEGPPKTPRSRRTIRLAPSTVALLRELRRAGGLQAEYVLVNPETHEPWHPDALGARWTDTVARVRKAQKPGDTPIPRLTIHGMRHTHAVVSLQQGVDVKTLSARLGHKDVAFTLNRYGRFIPELDAEAAAATAIVV